MTPLPRDPKTQQAIADVQARMQAVYPEAVFHLSAGEDPAGLLALLGSGARGVCLDPRFCYKCVSQRLTVELPV